MILFSQYWFYLLLPVIFYTNSLWIFGLSKLFHVELIDNDDYKFGDIKRSRGLFWFVSMLSFKVFGQRASNALCVCPPCMASIHSTYYYWIPALLFGFHWIMIPLYLNYMICLSGYNYIRSND